MSKNHFNSNETLECCDVSVSQQGNIAVDPTKYNVDGMERLGVPSKSVRGRVRVADGLIKFDPYDEASRRPTFSKQVVVGSTTISVTEDKVKIAFLVGRHMSKEIMLMYIQSEIDEVKRRLALDVYDSVVSKRVNDNDNVEKEGGQS